MENGEVGNSYDIFRNLAKYNAKENKNIEYNNFSELTSALCGTDECTLTFGHLYIQGEEYFKKRQYQNASHCFRAALDWINVMRLVNIIKYPKLSDEQKITIVENMIATLKEKDSQELLDSVRKKIINNQKIETLMIDIVKAIHDQEASNTEDIIEKIKAINTIDEIDSDTLGSIEMPDIEPIHDSNESHLNELLEECQSNLG